MLLLFEDPKWSSFPVRLLRLFRPVALGVCCGQGANSRGIANGMRRGGEDERRFRVNHPAQYSAQTEQGLASTASTMAVQALANDFVVGVQGRLLPHVRAAR